MIIIFKKIQHFMKLKNALKNMDFLKLQFYIPGIQPGQIMMGDHEKGLGFIKSVHQSIFEYLPEYQHLSNLKLLRITLYRLLNNILVYIMFSNSCQQQNVVIL